jgi:hypothetical protein
MEFDDIEVISQNGLAKVVLEYIGEGVSGDYDDEDPEDQPLLRYTLFRKNDGNKDIGNVAEDVGMEWCTVTDGSYCTNLSIYDDRNKLVQLANYILIQVTDGLTSCKREKRLYEQLSHISIDY